MHDLALLFFVKNPAPGRVKTRLAADVGAERAAAIYRLLVESICARVPRDFCKVLVHFDPAEKRAEVEAWLRPLLPPGAAFHPQCAGDLGARLTHAFAKTFAEGFQKAAVIGSDCVELDEPIFRAAFNLLDTHDCALGPAEDGGYYLLALKKAQPALFQDIAWSTAQTSAQTLDRARAAGLAVALLPQLRDVDTESDWKAAAHFLRKNDARPAAAGRPHDARNALHSHPPTQSQSTPP